jgi:hypothetical protein
VANLPKWVQRLLTVLLAVVVALIVRVLLVNLLDVSLHVPAGAGCGSLPYEGVCAPRHNDSVDVGIRAVAVTAAGAGLLAWAVLEALERFAGRRAKTVWTAIAASVLVLSLLPVPFLADTGVSLKWTLVAFHVAVAATLIPLMRRTVTPSPSNFKAELPS